ncbi:hypothetical protein KRR26_34280 [Corallococcus sp. M34]|uniref:hypothetical protein n=1 Tax=Citreicoccus inhibens TaxID=2849499 RepID=UPI001C24CFF7|nr:hypothetical protein [Citreicoccus inhibens]MBU8900689.1 hypothetical protein [Citreicoccus inhibens]
MKSLIGLMVIGLFVACGGAVVDAEPAEGTKVGTSEDDLTLACANLYETAFDSDATYTTAVGWSSCYTCGALPQHGGKLTAYSIVAYFLPCH